MFVSGFTFIRNAIKYDYPIVEAIESILPLCDELVVAVGKSDDDTLTLIEAINSPKIKIFETIWDDSLREGGQVLAIETNKALAKISPNATWAIYIQGDECFHEKDFPVIKKAMQRFANDTTVEGFLFNYKHFYGSFNYLAVSRKWYRNEIRIVRPKIGLQSYRDAQGFRIDNRKLNVVELTATVFHYGWVKHPEKQQAKQVDFHKMWHNDAWVKANVKQTVAFDYTGIDKVSFFEGEHPAVFQSRVDACDWEVLLNPKHQKMKLKYKLLHLFEDITGYRLFDYKNFKVIARFSPKFLG